MAPNSNVRVSFIAKVELIQPRPQHPGGQNGSGWTPPISAEAFDRGQARLFTWKDGNMQTFNGQCPEANRRYSAATIFNQGQSKVLFSVMCDAADAGDRSVIDAGDWRSLKFEAAPAAPTLSQVGPNFKNDTLRARGGQHWVGQLLPSRYHHQGSHTNGPTITGLVGELPILIALAALSTSEAKFKDVLPASIKEYKWIPHDDGQGRLRGMYNLDP